ncbi:MAG: phosphoribosylanthranilate isomerase [Oscillospiraceae bacterium]|nr:phosphoribosylanthranilate isomerase [Oscillospiraceae bacterium]
MSKVKICGLSRAEDIAAVNAALPDYVGFVFAPSRRRIGAAEAAALRERMDAKIKAVGVFVNQDAGEVAALYRSGVIDLAQLHGDEDQDYIARLKADCGCPVIKAAGVGRAPPKPPRGADYVLFDTLSPQRGGTGRVFDWGLLDGYEGPPFFIAGGLSALNVARAVRELAPFCVDVSGGVETGGLKDANKIYEFVRIAREGS